MEATMTTGAELRIEDVVNLWFNCAATVLVLRPYTGPLSYLWNDRAQIATFPGRSGRVDMTIGPDDQFILVHRRD